MCTKNGESRRKGWTKMKSSIRVVARFKGGVGNQMFIYAAARQMAAANGAELVLDTQSGFQRDRKYKRTFGLSDLPIQGRMATPVERHEPFAFLRRPWLRLLSRALPLHARPYICESGPGFQPEIRKIALRRSIYLDGLWQSEEYFREVSDLIKRELTPRAPTDAHAREIGARMSKTHSIALHVRNFAKTDRNFQPILGPEYYSRAVRELAAPTSEIFLFSDDPPSAKSCIGDLPYPITLVTTPNAAPLTDLWLMMQCRHFVIANSTFSWWAAWLGEKERSSVVAPGCKCYGVGAWGFDGLIPRRWRIV